MTDITLGDHTFAKFVDDKQIVWDASSLASFGACPRMYQLNNIQGWKRETEGAATAFGKAVHYGLEVLDTARFYKKDKATATKEAVIAVLDDYGEKMASSTDNARDLEAALRAVVWQAEDHWDDNMRVAAMPDETPACEVRFECPFPGTDYRFSGRIDKIAKLDGELYIVDFKTTKSGLNDYYFARYSPNTQIYAYLWATRNILKLPVRGFVVDGIQTGVNFTRFGRAVFNVSDTQLAEWERDTRLALEQATKYYDEGYYPQNFGACGNYGGCDYRTVCSRAPEHRETWLAADFVKKPYGTRETTK
jgi:hypothetical protein